MALSNLFKHLSRRKSPHRKSLHRRFSKRLLNGFEPLETRALLAGMYVGTNIDGVVDWGATAFVDVMNEARNWQTRNIDSSGPWTTELGSQIPIDDNGWPTEVPFDPGNGEQQQVVHTVIPVRGAGTYQWAVEGTGSVSLSAHDGLLVPDTPFGRTLEFDFTGGAQTVELEIHDSEFGNGIGHLFMTITASDPADPIRNMDLISPGHTTTYESQPFQESWTDELDPFVNIRFMDWGSTNNNPLQTWGERTTLDSYSQSREQGVSLEYQIALSNQLQQDAWFTVPAAADDDYVRNMAAMIRDNLDPNLKVYVEYSNETWNSIFQQTSYVIAQGEALGLDADPWVAGQKYVSQRSAEIWHTFEQEFGVAASDRLVKVMATQASFDFISRTRMEALLDPTINPTGIMPDALAIAPYFGGAVADEVVAEGLVDTITTDEILDRAQTDLRGDVTSWVTSHKALADEFDIWLITYEGGQHLVGTFENVNNETLTEKLIAANRDPRMYDLYTEYLDMLHDGGVSLHSNFSYIAEPSKWGSWGVMEDQDQPLSEAHKYRALTDWATANPVSNLVPIARAGGDIQLVDDGDGSVSVTLDGSASRDLDGTVATYQWQTGGQVVGNSATLELDLDIGLHQIQLTVTDDTGGVATDSIVVTVAPQQAGGVLVESDFVGAAPGQNQPWTGVSQLDNHVTISGWRTGPGFSGSDADDVFSFVGVFDADESDLAEAFANDRYLSFSIEPSGDRMLDLRGAEISFAIDRIDWFAPRQYVVTSSVGGHSIENVLFDTGYFESLGESSFTFTMPFAGFQTNEAVEFRIYGSAGRYGGHDSGLSAFRLHGGTVSDSENTAPVAVDDSLDTARDTSLVILAADLLGNDIDADGDTLNITEVAQPTNGTLVDNGDGTFTYTPAAGFIGTDTFRYTISDGGSQSPTPVDSVRQYTFNHSLWEDSLGTNASTGHWIGELANAAGTDYAWNGQFGQLDYHQIGDYQDINSGPTPQLGSANSDDVFPDESTHFRDIDIDNVLIMPPNFVQAGNSTAQAEFIDHAQRVIDYVVDDSEFGGQQSQATIFIYEHWQEAAAYPLNDSQWTDFHTETTGSYHEWFLDYQTQLEVSRPDVDFRMIPVGPIIADILQNPSLPASGLDFAEMYRDEAPHGTPNAYFLAGLISYQAMYGQQAAADYAPPSTADPVSFSDGGVSSELGEDFAALNDFVWERLQFYNDSGVRVWSGDGNGEADTATVSIDVHPAGELVAVDLQITDTSGQPVSSLTTGDTFHLHATVDDLREAGQGVFSAYVDIVYDGLLASVDGEIAFGDAYTAAREGSVAIAGLIDEVGAVGNTTPTGSDPITLFRVPMIATEAGELTFSSNAAEFQPEHEITLYGRDTAVPANLVRFGTITIDVQLANQDPIAVDDAFSVFNDGLPMTLDVLQNDVTEEAGEILSLIAVSTGSHGGQVQMINDQLVYTPVEDFYGWESFTYVIGDGNGGTAEATVSVEVGKRWHNSELATDVNGDARVSPQDAVLIINVLLNQGNIVLPHVPNALSELPLIDVNDDQMVTPLDALLVINELNRRAELRAQNAMAEGEGETHIPAAVAEFPRLGTQLASDVQREEYRCQVGHVETSELAMLSLPLDEDSHDPETVFGDVLEDDLLDEAILAAIAEDIAAI